MLQPHTNLSRLTLVLSLPVFHAHSWASMPQACSPNIPAARTHRRLLSPDPGTVKRKNLTICVLHWMEQYMVFREMKNAGGLAR